MSQASQSSIEFTPVGRHAPKLLIHAVSDGRRLGLQLHGIHGVGRELARDGAWWQPGRRMWMLQDPEPIAAAAWLNGRCARQLVDRDRMAEQILTALRRAMVGSGVWR